MNETLLRNWGWGGGREIVTYISKDFSDDVNIFYECWVPVREITLFSPECGLAGVIFLMCLVYLPSKPPTPPSASASIQRTNYKEALGSVARFVLI